MKENILSTSAKIVSSSSGLVGNFKFYVLPTISPMIALFLVILFQLPAYYKIWISPTKDNLIRCLLYCSLCSFHFGYHVHEKAIIISQVLSIFMCFQSTDDAILFLTITMAGFYSLFPLIFQTNELFIKGTNINNFIFHLIKINHCL